MNAIWREPVGWGKKKIKGGDLGKTLAEEVIRLVEREPGRKRLGSQGGDSFKKEKIIKKDKILQEVKWNEK